MHPILEEIAEELRQHPKLVIADDYEVSVRRTSRRTNDFRNGEPSRETLDDNLWIGLRILHRRRAGRSATQFHTRDSLGRLVEAAFESALRSSVDPWFRFPIWKPPRAQNASEPSSAPIGYESVHSKLNFVPDLFEESYSTGEVETLLARKTERFQLKHASRTHSARFGVLNHSAREEGDYFWLREERESSLPLEEKEDWVEALLMQSVALTEAKRFDERGAYFTLLSPAVGAALLKRIGPWFRADLVQAGRSPLSERRDKPLFSGAIGILDHGNFPGAAFAAPFDMEGSLTQETTVVQRGVLKDLLYDTYSATRENRLSTGNYLLSGESSLPGIGTSQLYFKPSTYRPADLCRAMGEGIILQSVDKLERVPGTETSFMLSGSGWRVSGGQCVESLREIGLTFDVFELLKRAVEIGNDLTFFGSCGAPSILLENIPLGIEGTLT